MSTQDAERLVAVFGDEAIIEDRLNPDRGFKVAALDDNYYKTLEVKRILEKKYGTKISWPQFYEICMVVLTDMKKTKHKTKNYGEGKEHFKQRRKKDGK